MSNLDNITGSIQDKAQAQIDQIKADLDEKIRILEEDKDAEIARLKNQILNRAEVEAANEKDKVLSEAELTARDQVLTAKKNALDQAFESAAEKLRTISDEEYRSFVEKNLSSIDLQGSEVLVPQEGREASLEGLDIEIADQERAESGFFVRSGDISYNFEFSDMVNFYRQEIEGEIADLLFSEEA